MAIKETKQNVNLAVLLLVLQALYFTGWTIFSYNMHMAACIAVIIMFTFFVLLPYIALATNDSTFWNAKITREDIVTWSWKRKFLSHVMAGTTIFLFTLAGWYIFAIIYLCSIFMGLLALSTIRERMMVVIKRKEALNDKQTGEL